MRVVMTAAELAELQKSAKTPELSTVHRPLGTHGLWGDKDAQLPAYIQNVAHALIRDGHDESGAIAMAVAAVKRWAAGGDHVTPEVQAAAGRAVAEWEELKASHSKTKSFASHFHADELRDAHGRWASGGRIAGLPSGWSTGEHTPQGHGEPLPRAGSIAGIPEMWGRGDLPDPSEHGEPVHGAGRFAGGNIAWARGEIPDPAEHGGPVRRGGMPSMPRAWTRGDLPSPDEIVSNAEAWRKKEPASRGQLVYVRQNGKRVPAEYHSMTPDGKLRVSLRDGEHDFDPADVEIWQPPHLQANLGRRGIANARFSTRKALSDDEFLAKVGPHGYTHGWVFHGTPGSTEHADVIEKISDDLYDLNQHAADHLRSASISMKRGNYHAAKKYLENAQSILDRDRGDDTKKAEHGIKAISNHIALTQKAIDTYPDLDYIRDMEYGLGMPRSVSDLSDSELETELARRKTRSPAVVKVGPHGYTHGWVFHGTPGSQEHADFLSSSADAIHSTVGGSGLAGPVHDTLKGAASSIQSGDISGAKKQLQAAALAAHRVAESGNDKAIPGMEHPARNVAFVMNYHADLLNGAELTGRDSHLPDRPEAQVTAKRLAHGLASGIVKEKAPGEGAMGETRMVTFGDGSRWVRKRDAMIGQDREVLSSRVSDALGAGAPEVIFEPGWKPGDVNPVIWEPMLPGMPAVEKEALEGDGSLEKYYGTPQGKRIGLLDSLTSNIDRNKGNWLINDNGITPIDHGESLYNGWNAESEFARRISGSSFTPQEWDSFEKNLADLQPDFESLGHGDWHQQMMDRLAQVRNS